MAAAPDPVAARDLLGVGPETDLAGIRRAYRELMRRHHPDVTGGGDPATAAALAEAYAVLRRGSPPGASPPPDAGPRPSPPPDGPPAVHLVAPGVLAVEAPPDETFLRLLDVLEDLGEVTYRDRSAGDVGALVRLGSDVACALAASLEPRAIDTLVTVDLEPLDPAASVDPGAFVAWLADQMSSGS